MSRGTLNIPLEDYHEFGRLSAATSFEYFEMMRGYLVKDTRRCMRSCAGLVERVRVQGVDEDAQADLDFWYRALVRAFATEVEGLLFVMRQIVGWAQERGDLQLEVAEASLVSEQAFYVNVKRKRIEGRDKNNTMLENFVLSFTLFPRVFRSTFETDYSSRGWEMLQKVVEARNSITHPKSPGDTVLDPGMYGAISEALSWFYGSISDLFAAADQEFMNRSFSETSKDPRIRELLNCTLKEDA